MTTFREEKEPLHIKHNTGTPGIPVETSWMVRVFRKDDDGTERQISSEQLTDCRTSPEDVEKFLGAALALARQRETAARAEADAATRERDAHAAAHEATKEQLATTQADHSAAQEQVADLTKQLAAIVPAKKE